MTGNPPAALGTALAASIAKVRAQLASPTATIGVVVPSEVSGVLLRQQLALVGPFLGVEFFTPERLVRDLSRPRVPEGWTPEPAAWLRTVVGVLLERAAEAGELVRYGDALRQPGWRRPVARAVEQLEAAGIGPEDLATFEQLDPIDLAPRAQVLATVLRAVRDRRLGERLLSFSDSCALAREALTRGGHGPGHRIAGAVLVGDKLLGPDVFGVVRAWLEQRPHRAIQPAPLANLEPAPHGLRSAASGPVDTVEQVESCALASVQARLYRSLSGAQIAADRSVALVTTPDEVRDIGEAVREVRRAIRDGVALDQIAIVIPDADQADVLQAALDTAGIPATWLIGPALVRAPEARGLLLAVALAAGEDTCRDWHALLSHPGLNLRRGLASTAGLPTDVAGRGRWRRILAKCGAVRGTPAIVTAIERWAASLAPEQRDDQAAAATLAATIRQLDRVFEAWRSPDTLGAYRARFCEFLDRWWRASARRERLATALADWGPPHVGFRITLNQALAELRDTLGQAQDLDGRLSDARVRVLSPMLCLGGAFERVCVTGLTQKRLPTDAREDPLIPDAMLDALAAKHDVTLLTSRLLHEFEDRRFAAIVGACTGRLWLASPELEMLTERRLVPSSHLLAIQSVLAGRRVGYAALREAMQRSGSRAHPFALDPEDAVGELELAISRARSEPARTLSDLAARPDTRRLLGLHRALDSTEPTAWTGLVSPELLQIPGLTTEGTIPAAQLAALLRDPGLFLFRQVLRAWPAVRLPTGWDPRHAYTLADSVRAAIVVAVEAGDPSFERMVEAWVEALRERAASNPHIDEVDLRMAQRLAETSLAAFQTKAGELAISIRQLVGQPFDTTWQVEASDVWFGPGEVLAIRAKIPTNAEFPIAAAELTLAGRLAQLQGLPIDDVAIVDGSGSSRRASFVDCMAPVQARARVVADLLARGWLPRTTANEAGARLRNEPTTLPWTGEDP